MECVPRRLSDDRLGNHHLRSWLVPVRRRGPRNLHRYQRSDARLAADYEVSAEWLQHLADDRQAQAGTGLAELAGIAVHHAARDPGGDATAGVADVHRPSPDATFPGH